MSKKCLRGKWKQKSLFIFSSTFHINSIVNIYIIIFVIKYFGYWKAISISHLKLIEVLSRLEFLFRMHNHGIQVFFILVCRCKKLQKKVCKHNFFF